MRVLAGLQDDRGDFDGAEHDPGDRSAVLSSDPKTDGGAEAKDCACPSAGHRGRLAQYFQYSLHSFTPWKRATNLDRESIQIGAQRLYNPVQMEERARKPGLIPNRQAAVLGVILTGFVAAVTFRNAYLHPARHFHWLFPLDFMLPKWALWAVNGAFYGYLLWLCFVFFRMAQGKERVVVVGWFLGIVLYPIKSLVSTPAAVAIQYVEAAGMAVAFLAALDILLRFFVTNKARS